MQPYYRDDRLTIYHGDAATIMAELPPDSVSMAAFSPPYLAQRTYGTSLHEIGQEDDPREYVRRLLDAARLVMRLVSVGGSCFVNLGDKYNVDGSIKNRSTPAGYARARRQPRWPGMSQKSLMMLPARFAIGCTDDLGLAVRAEIVWDKRNGGADGKATDRVRRGHEMVYHLTHRLKHGERIRFYGETESSVWTIPSVRSEDHDATYPLPLVDRMVLGWSTVDDVVLDPFAGDGTTIWSALEHGRRAIAVDLEERFCENMARRRRELLAMG